MLIVSFYRVMGDRHAGLYVLGFLVLWSRHLWVVIWGGPNLDC